jgi:predicted nucleotidyltransferase
MNPATERARRRVSSAPGCTSTTRRGKGLLALIGFAHAVEDVLGVHVDVVSEGELGESRDGICRDAVPV